MQGPVSLERAHVYCVDKQQVSIIQVSSDKDSRSQGQSSNHMLRLKYLSQPKHVWLPYPQPYSSYTLITEW